MKTFSLNGKRKEKPLERRSIGSTITKRVNISLIKILIKKSNREKKMEI